MGEANFDPYGGEPDRGDVAGPSGHRSDLSRDARAHRRAVRHAEERGALLLALEIAPPATVLDEVTWQIATDLWGGETGSRSS